MILEEREWKLVDLPEMLDKAFSVSEHPIVGYFNLVDTYNTGRYPSPPAQMYRTIQRLVNRPSWLGIDVEFDFDTRYGHEYELVIATITVYISSLRVPYISLPLKTRSYRLIGRVSLHWDKADLNRIPYDVVRTSFEMISGYFGKGGKGGGGENEPEPWEPEPWVPNPEEPVLVPVKLRRR